MAFLIRFVTEGTTLELTASTLASARKIVDFLEGSSATEITAAHVAGAPGDTADFQELRTVSASEGDSLD